MVATCLWRYDPGASATLANGFCQDAHPKMKALRLLLQDFGVPRDGALIVHSAIASLSRQGLRAEDMIETLLDHMADGNLFMPTMTWRTVTPAQPAWDEIHTASETGVLTEVFRARYAVARSIHPTHSVAGWGPDAARL